MPKRKENQQHQGRSKQRKSRKRQRKAAQQRPCWVQECPELLPPPGEVTDSGLMIRISVAPLQDGYQNLVTPETSQLPQESSSSRAHRLVQPLSDETAVVVYTERLPHAPLPPTPPPLPKQQQGDADTDKPANVHPKYWSQRYRYFPRYDDGIRMTDAAWYSVTPAVLAQHMARRLLPPSVAAATSQKVILDACCGVGGNTIALAQTHPNATIVAVDTDRTSLECLAHNAVTVYGIPASRFLLLQLDVVQVLQCYDQGQRVETSNKNKNTETQLPVSTAHDAKLSPPTLLPPIHTTTDCLPTTLDAIFLSPPWGGTDYSQQRHFTLDGIALEQGSARTLLTSAVRACPSNSAYYLPRNTNGLSLGTDLQRCCHLRGSVELEQLYLHHKLKAVVLYIHVATAAKEGDDATAAKSNTTAPKSVMMDRCCIQ